MAQQVLLVDGVLQTDLERYVLRFVINEDSTRAGVLYRDGKRVTRPWRFIFDEDHHEDTQGASANTA